MHWARKRGRAAKGSQLAEYERVNWGKRLATGCVPFLGTSFWSAMLTPCSRYPGHADGQLGGSSNPLAGSQAQLKEMRKQRKNIREKKRREEIAAKIEQLGQMLSMSEKERGEKQAVLVATLRAIETLRAQNAHLRGQKHKLSNHLKHLTSSLQKAFPAAQPAAQPAAGGSPTIDTSSLTELFMAPTPGPSMAEAAQRGARPNPRVESMGVENGSGNFDFTSL